jgi:hypothetical protein
VRRVKETGGDSSGSRGSSGDSGGSGGSSGDTGRSGGSSGDSGLSGGGSGDSGGADGGTHERGNVGVCDTENAAADKVINSAGGTKVNAPLHGHGGGSSQTRALRKKRDTGGRIRAHEKEWVDEEHARARADEAARRAEEERQAAQARAREEARRTEEARVAALAAAAAAREAAQAAAEAADRQRLRNAKEQAERLEQQRKQWAQHQDTLKKLKHEFLPKWSTHRAALQHEAKRSALTQGSLCAFAPPPRCCTRTHMHAPSHQHTETHELTDWVDSRATCPDP